MHGGALAALSDDCCCGCSSATVGSIAAVAIASTAAEVDSPAEEEVRAELDGFRATTTELTVDRRLAGALSGDDESPAIVVPGARRSPPWGVPTRNLT